MVFPNDTPNIKMQTTGADVTGLPKDDPVSDLERWAENRFAMKLKDAEATHDR
jgi:hypothetical protein